MDIKEFVIPFGTLFIREVRRFMRVIFQTIATPLINSTLYLLIFGVSIGGSIETYPGISYLAFLIPGLVMMGSLRNSFDNSVGSIVTSKFVGELEDLKIAPLSPIQIVLANGFAATLRGFIVAGITLLIGYGFFWWIEGSIMAIEHPLILIGFLFIGSLAFASFGLGVCMLAKSFEQVNAINTFVLLPLIYLGGVFFSLENLHPFWKILSRINPLLWMVGGVRFGILGVSDVGMLPAFFITLATWLLCASFAVFSLKKGSYHRW